MDIIEKQEDRRSRIHAVDNIVDRIASLERKTKTSRRKFCSNHDIHASHLSKVLNYKVLPDWPMIQKIQSALEAEGF